MSIRKTESRLPLDYNAFELGEVVEETKTVSIAGSDIEASFALISYLTSPIAIGSKIDFVLFVENVPDSDRDNWEYNWKTVRVSTNEVIEKDDGKEEGTFNVKPDFIGEIITSVEVVRDNVSVITLNMKQEIVALDQILEMFLGNEGMVGHLGVDKSIGSLGGDETPSRELINNFRKYVFEAIKPAPPPPFAPKPDIDIPVRFLAALAYALITRRPKNTWFGKDRDDIIEDVAADLNDDPEKVKKLEFNEGIGVCAILPQMLAMVLKRPGTDNSFTTGTELPSNLDERRQKYKEITENLNNLADAADVKIDIFNLIRFPKSNLRMCTIYLRKLIDRARRWENISSNDLINNEFALRIVATEYNIGGTESPLPPTEGPPAPTDAHPNEFGNKIVDRLMKIPAIAIYFADFTSEGAFAYGGYDLQRGDNDDAHRWGGFDFVGPIPPGETTYVEALQQDLTELGFKIVGTPNGKFEMSTEWAVREFQIYAKMPFIAKETGGGGSYVDRLSRTVNILPYTGPISGVVNLATRIAIQYWKANQWRCPVVIGAYDNTGTNLINNAYNIWLHDDITTNNAKIYARDFSGYYQYPEDPNRINADKFRIGRYTTMLWGGPVSLWWDCWSEMEILPNNLIRDGVNYNGLTQSERTTFRVLRAVAENECLGFFDSKTAYDRAVMSSGLCHWTITLISGDEASEGELCAYLSYLKYRDSNSFREAFGNFGLNIDKRWIDSSGKELFDDGQRKYKAWVQLQKEDFSYEDIPRTRNEILYLNTWHWFYRFVMAGRTIKSYRLRMWDMARMRIRDILTTPFRNAANIPQVPESGGNRTAKIGDIFTSEEAVAMLYRWHIYSPAQVISNGVAGNRIEQAVENANIPVAAGNPTQWNSDHEQLLITSLKERVDAVAVGADDPLEDTIEKAMVWPNIDGRFNYSFGAGIPELSSDRNSFTDHFNEEGLPPQVL